jgi:hypothetical protein
VEREYSVQQPLVFTAPPLPARAQVVILARALMGPHSTPSIALAGQQHVILSMECTATLKEMSVPLQLLHSVQSKMVQQQTTRTAGAEVWNARVPQD